jgi:hypothetical protein
MFRLTLVLAMLIGGAMLVAGRDLTPQERSDLGIKPKAEAPHPRLAAAVAAPAPEPAAPVAEVVPEAVAVAPAPPAVSEPSAEDAIKAAVELAMATDSLEQAPELDAGDDVPAAEAGVPVAAETPAAEPQADPPSVADEVAAALSASQVWYVNATKVNVREGPSTDFAVVGQMAFGDATEILSDPEDEWVRIRIQGDGVEGYIARRFLQDTEPNG